MSFNIIHNDNQFQLGTVFEIPKHEETSKVRFNEILIQKKKSDISFNNNCLRFLRKGVDYLNKPLKYLYEGNYDDYNYYYLLNQIFIPPYINYNSIDDYIKQINKNIEENILNSAFNIYSNMYLYSKSIKEPIYPPKNDETETQRTIKTNSKKQALKVRLPNIFDVDTNGNSNGTEICIAVFEQTSGYPPVLTLKKFDTDFNLVTILSQFNQEFHYNNNTNQSIGIAGIKIISLDSPISDILNYRMQFNNIYNNKFLAVYTLKNSDLFYNASEFLKNNTIQVYNLNEQYKQICYPNEITGEFKYLIGRCDFVVYEITTKDNVVGYISIDNNLQDILENPNYVIVKLNYYNTYPTDITGSFIFGSNDYKSVMIKDDISIYSYGLSEDYQPPIINNGLSIDVDYSELGNFTLEIYNPESQENQDNSGIIDDENQGEGNEPIDYKIEYVYSMVTDYYTNTKINNLNNDITNINIRLKYENRYEYYNKQGYEKYTSIKKILHNNKKYNINGSVGNFVYSYPNTNETIIQRQIIQDKYYKPLFNNSISGNLNMAAFSIIIWINPDPNRINDYITTDDGSKYLFQLKEGDQLLCIKNEDIPEQQYVIELTNFNTSSTADGQVIVPKYLEFEFIPVFNENSQLEPNNVFSSNEGVWFLNFQILHSADSDKPYIDELDILIDDLEEYIESLNGETLIKFKNKEIELTSDISSLIYKLEKVPLISNPDKFYGKKSELSPNESIQYQTNNSKNMRTFIQYVISGFIVNITSIQSITDVKSIEHKNNIFRYEHYYPVLNENTNEISKYNKEKYFMIGDLIYQFIKSKEYYTAQVPEDYEFLKQLYQSDNIYNALPNIKLQHLKINNLLEDELFFNYFKHKYFIKHIDNHLKFSIDIIPVEFNSDINSNNLNSILEANEIKNGIDIQNQLTILPKVLQRTQKREFHLYDTEKYLYELNKCDKFYTLFGQFSKSLWNRLGINPNKIEYKNLFYNVNSDVKSNTLIDNINGVFGNNSYNKIDVNKTDVNKTKNIIINSNNDKIRCYNYFGTNITQEIYNCDDLDLNVNIFSHKLHIYSHEQLYNPKKSHIYDGMSNKIYEFGKLVSELNMTLLKKDFKLYSHGEFIITDEYEFNIQPGINFDDFQYNVKLSYSKNIDDIINNNLNSTEVEKNYVNIKESDKYYSIDLNFENLIYSFENNDSIYLYIDSKNHYPFLSGTNAILKVEYI